MSYELAPYAPQDANLAARFDALAQVAGSNIAKIITPKVVPGIAIIAGGIGGALEGKWEGKGQLANAVIASAAWAVALMAGDNADLRHGAVGVASGMGASAASLFSYNKMVNRTAGTVAPAPTVVA